MPATAVRWVRPTVHVISATAVQTNEGTHNLSMCGEDLGAYLNARDAGHIVGNYSPPDVVRAHVTCQTCRERMGVE